MATLENGINFTGSLGNLSAYKMKGSDKIILRTKGGPTKNQIQKSPRFERTRLNNSEFAGAIKAMQNIRFALAQVSWLADYNFTPQLTGLCKSVQHLDPVNRRGERNVILSRHHDLLEGFRLNRKHPLNSIITTPITGIINREKKSALVKMPRLINGVNMILPWKYPVYRFIITLGTAADVLYDKQLHKYHVPAGTEEDRHCLHTAWYISGQPFIPYSFELQLQSAAALKNEQVMILSIGIQMGAPDDRGEISAVTYAGSASILAAG
jgi:hypothetical protein